MNRTILPAFAAALVLGLGACKRDSDEPATPSTGHEHHHATVRADFAFRVNDHPYTLDSVLTDGSGHAVKLDVVRFFISGAHAINDEGHVVGEFPEAYMLLDPSQASNDFELGEMEVAHIHEIEFDLGLDSALNHSDPATYSEPPLNDLSMHWTWSTGYIFVKLEGRVNDDDADDVVDPDDPTFQVHGVGDDLLRSDGFHVHHTLVEGETFTGAAVVQMSGILSGIDVLANPDQMGDTPLTRQAMDNLVIAVDEAE